VVLLRVLGDLTVEQVGRVMGRSVASVKALQRRGLRALREELGTSSERVGSAAHPFAAARR
jgi:RNA polymerase sigma-70 factor (ECF subfamily)